MTNQVIPEAAVIAASKALMADKMSNHSGDNAPQIMDACEKVARKVLEAAAPHIHQESIVKTISTASEIENMPAGSVIIGPEWNAEVYAYVGDSFWYAPGSDVPWDEHELEARGPFTVIHEPASK